MWGLSFHDAQPMHGSRPAPSHGEGLLCICKFLNSLGTRADLGCFLYGPEEEAMKKLAFVFAAIAVAEASAGFRFTPIVRLPYSRRPLIYIKEVLLFRVLFHAMRPVLERTMAQTIISYLERRYTALETEIPDALRQSPTDDLAIADLKYRKLIIADEIQRLVEHFSKLGLQ
jgi:hypothetical protein